MFKPSDEKSMATHQLIETIFAGNVQKSDKYMIVYAYYIKTSLFGKKILNYVVGFSAEDTELVIIPIDSDGTSGSAVTLNKDQIVSAKRGLQGDTKIKTAGETYQFVVPPYTPAASEATYMLPIIQEDEATKFMAFIKESF